MLVVGRRVLPWVLWQVVAHRVARAVHALRGGAGGRRSPSRAAELFGVSLALGAFFAGMVLRESEFSQRAAEESLPLRDAFAVLFFVSVGMLFDPAVLLERPLQVLATTWHRRARQVAGRRGPGARAALPAQRRRSRSSASLAQIGEFSFILALGTAGRWSAARGQASLVRGRRAAFPSR
jgi:CPA2 family monovalent cation:H+ antiporter-2